MNTLNKHKNFFDQQCTRTMSSTSYLATPDIFSSHEDPDNQVGCPPERVGSVSMIVKACAPHLIDYFRKRLSA